MTSTETVPKQSTPLVYVVRIGKHMKIGFTTDLAQRLKSFATSTAEQMEVMATFPGGRDQERRLHDSLAESRLPRGEFFRWDYRLANFITFVGNGDLEKAWEWLSQTHPSVRKRQKEEGRRNRDAVRRMNKAEMDAHCAQLVAERRRTLGW